MKTFEEWLAGVAMLGVMTLGGWQAYGALTQPGIHDIPTSLADIRSGVTGDKFSHFLDDHLPWRPDLIAWANAGRYVLVRGAGDQVRLGSDEWLFSVEEIEYFKQASEFQRVRTGVIGRLSDALKHQNVRLVVALVPDKARIQVQQFMGHRYPEWYQDRYANILQQLKAHQVTVVDVQQAMRLAQVDQPDRSLYYRTDTHWNQAGSRATAQALAQAIRQTGLAGEPVAFQTDTNATATQRVGDLLRMMGLGDMPDLFRPNPDTEHTDTTRKLEGGTSLGLLGDIQVPVTLVGTSYSLRANFQGYLQASLQADVLNVAQDGGGFMQSMASYLKDDAFKSSPPQVLVWEIPERVFSRPLAANESQMPRW
jgi:alginate O-acetyltransferase complex protein AlgJ